MFDTIAGLPLHALILHVTVIGIPLMSLVTIAVAVRPTWRTAMARVVGANVLLVACCFVTLKSGQALQDRLESSFGQPVAVTHGERAELLPWFTIGLLVASVLAFLLLRTRSAGALAGAIVLVVVAGVAATAWTVVVGDSGSRAVWEDTVKNTHAPD
jgi:hypothetical protein